MVHTQYHFFHADVNITVIYTYIFYMHIYGDDIHTEHNVEGLK